MFNSVFEAIELGISLLIRVWEKLFLRLEQKDLIKLFGHFH